MIFFPYQFFGNQSNSGTKPCGGLEYLNQKINDETQDSVKVED